MITLSGEFDLTVKPSVDAAIERALSADLSAPVIDLRRLTFIDSSGIHSLGMGHRGGERRGCSVSAVRGTRSVHGVLELCGLAERLKMIEDPGQAPEPCAQPVVRPASGQAA